MLSLTRERRATLEPPGHLGAVSRISIQSDITQETTAAANCHGGEACLTTSIGFKARQFPVSATLAVTVFRPSRPII